MEMRCAECGCLVDAGRVVARCGNPECCCRDLPDKPWGGADSGRARCIIGPHEHGTSRMAQMGTRRARDPRFPAAAPPESPPWERSGLARTGWPFLARSWPNAKPSTGNLDLRLGSYIRTGIVALERWRELSGSCSQACIS